MFELDLFNDVAGLNILLVIGNPDIIGVVTDRFSTTAFD